MDASADNSARVSRRARLSDRAALMHLYLHRVRPIGVIVGAAALLIVWAIEPHDALLVGAAGAFVSGAALGASYIGLARVWGLERAARASVYGDVALIAF